MTLFELQGLRMIISENLTYSKNPQFLRLISYKI
jgi:hypothetical protein